MLRTTSAPATASSTEPATRLAPSSRARSGVRFQSTRSWPAAARRRAMAAPILPVPCSVTLTAPSRAPVVARAGLSPADRRRDSGVTGDLDLWTAVPEDHPGTRTEVDV